MDSMSTLIKISAKPKNRCALSLPPPPPITKNDRIKGILVGAGLGDALGVPFETRQSAKRFTYTGKLEHRGHIFRRFEKPHHFSLSVGQISDDTEMMLIIARSLVKYNGRYNHDNIISGYLEWANHKTTFAMGTNTRKLFKGIKTVNGYTKRYEKISDAEREELQSNGALMRSAILALLDENTALRDCQLTNPGTVALDTNRVYLHMVREALKGTNKDDILSSLSLRAQTEQVNAVIIEALTNTDVRDVTVCKGWCLHGLYCAIYCLRNFTAIGTALDYTIGLGGDTDTNACIVGALMGAYYGLSSFMNNEVTKDNVELLLSVDTYDSDFPRPLEYTMLNVLELADSLEEKMIF